MTRLNRIKLTIGLFAFSLQLSASEPEISKLTPEQLAYYNALIGTSDIISSPGPIPASPNPMYPRSLSTPMPSSEITNGREFNPMLAFDFPSADEDSLALGLPTAHADSHVDISDLTRIETSIPSSELRVPPSPLPLPSMTPRLSYPEISPTSFEHPIINQDEPIYLPKEDEFRCDVCDKEIVAASAKTSLTTNVKSHFKAKHPELNGLAFNCRASDYRKSHPKCLERFSNFDDYKKHLNSKHNIIFLRSGSSIKRKELTPETAPKIAPIPATSSIHRASSTPVLITEPLSALSAAAVAKAKKTPLYISKESKMTCDQCGSTSSGKHCTKTIKSHFKAKHPEFNGFAFNCRASDFREHYPKCPERFSNYLKYKNHLKKAHNIYFNITENGKANKKLKSASSAMPLVPPVPPFAMPTAIAPMPLPEFSSAYAVPGAVPSPSMMPLLPPTPMMPSAPPQLLPPAPK